MASASLACLQYITKPLELKYFGKTGNMRKKSSSDPLIPRRQVNSINPRNIATIDGESFYTGSNRNITQSSPVPCCAAGEHFLTSNDRGFLSRSLSINSMVNVDINDISGDAEMLATTFSLKRCKQMVLRPYTWLLLLIGWRAFGKDKVLRYPKLWKCINIMYPIFVITLLWYSNIMQAVTCHGKLNPKTDTIPVTLAPPLTSPTPFRHFWEGTPSPASLNKTNSSPGCSHIITTYIIPSILHFLAFIYGFHYFRVQENEQLYSLMERVFVQAQTTTGVQELLIRNSRLFLMSAVAWLVAHIGLEVLYLMAFEMGFSSFAVYLNVESSAVNYFLILTRFLGLVMTQCVNIAVIINYCTQCEMLIMHIQSLCLHLHEKTVEIKDAMHEVLGIKEFISLLNGTLGKMTALCVVGFLELVIIGIGLLIFNQVQKVTVWAYRVVFLLMWLIATLFPVIQASRVSKTGGKLRHICLEMRVFGYQCAPQLELDSFVLFISTAILRAKLFGISIQPGNVVLSLIIVSLVVLVVIITDTVPISKYWTFL